MNAVLSAMSNGAVASAGIACAVWLAMAAIPGRWLNAATRYVVWWAVLAITVLLPAISLAPRFDGSRHVNSARAEAAILVKAGRIGTSARPAADGPASSRVWQFPISIPAGRWPRWAGIAWIAIASLMLLRLFVSCAALSVRKRRASEPPEMAGRVETWLAQCGSKRRARLAVSDAVPAPMVAGLFRPAILMPARLLDGLDEEELDLVGLHETAHLARGDDYALVLERLLEALLALHPVVRWIARRIDLEREIACDDFVVAATGRARPYAACLTKVAELTGGVHSPLAAAAAADERSHLTRRVDMLLDQTRHTGTRLLKARLGALVAGLMVLGYGGAHAPSMVALAMPAPEAVEVPAPPQGETARVGVSVWVEDPQHRVVTGLQQSDFRVFEDDLEQAITGFSNAEAPVSVGLVLDVSGNMREKFGAVQHAVLGFLRAADPADEFSVVTFNQSARVLIGLTHNAADVENRLAEVQLAGGTALWDALALSAGQMRASHNARQAIVAITDGSGDNSSSRSFADIASLLRETTAPVYMVAIGDPSAPAAFAPLRRMTDLAEQAGGTINVESLEGLPARLTRIGVELRNQYRIEYTPANAAQDGRFRRVRVEVVAPAGLPPLTVRAGSGYYAHP